MPPPMFIGLALFALVLAGCRADADLLGTEGANTPGQEEEVMEQETLPQEEGIEQEKEDRKAMVYRCRAPGHQHEEGELIAEYEGGSLVRWRCTLSSHHICTADADGVWKECTYPPDEIWPEPVAAATLENPPPPPGEEEDAPEFSEGY